MANTVQVGTPKKQEEIAAAKTGRYKGLAEANPYSDVQYQLGWWDRLGNTLGFRTQEDKRREELAQASAEYNSQLASLESEDKYNSPKAQAERMRAAGQNPDLLGTGEVAEAAQFNEPETTPEVPGQTNQEAAAQVGRAITTTATSLMSAATTAMGLIQSGINLEMTLNQAESQRLDNFQKYYNTAKEYVINTLSIPQLEKDKEIEPDAKYKGELETITKRAENDAVNLFYTGKQRRKFLKAIHEVTDKLPTTLEQYKEWAELEKTKQNAARTMASGGYGTIEEEVKFWEPIVHALEKIDKLKNEYEANQWENRTKKKLGDIQVETEEATAQAEKSEAGQRKQEAEIDKGINSIWKDAVDEADKLSKSSDKRDQRAGIALRIALLLAKTLEGKTPSFSTMNRQGPEGTTETRSFSW